MKIHINAGHGGKDPGACGNGLQEKNITLSVALLLGEELKKYGFEISYTRTTDTYIDPLNIAQKANGDGSDLFISIHTNAATSISANGIETLCYSLSGEESKIAQCVQSELITATGFTDRGVKERSDLVVLNSTSMPAMLIELGFITSKSDSIMIAKSNFQQRCAQAISKAIGEYYGISKVKEDGEMQEKTEIPQWQTDGLKNLVESGIIIDEAYWSNKMDKSITIGEVLGLIGKLVK